MIEKREIVPLEDLGDEDDARRMTLGEMIEKAKEYGNRDNSAFSGLTPRPYEGEIKAIEIGTYPKDEDRAEKFDLSNYGIPVI